MMKKINKYSLPTLIILATVLFLIFVPTNALAATNNILGPVDPPEVISKINTSSGGEIGALFLFSRIVRIASIIAGIYVIWNFVSAGFTYISSAGNTNAHATVRDKLTWSIVGIIVIVSAYTIIGLLSLFFYGDATVMLNPTLEKPF